MTTNLLSLRGKRANSLAFSLIAFFFFTVGALAQTITAVSPSTITNRTKVKLTGSGFPGSGLTVKLGATAGTAVAATVSYVSSSEIQIVAGATTADGTLNIYFGSSTTASGTLMKIAPLVTPSTARIDRMITDFGGYKSTTAATTVVGNMTNNRHNLTAFRYNSQMYSTGVADGVLNSHSAEYTYIPGDFRAFPLNEITGNTVSSGSSTFLSMGSLIDNDPDNAVYTSPAIANLKIRDVLVDGIKGLDIGTGVTNIAADVALVFPIINIASSRINDAEPDILVTQIAQPGNATDYDIFSFIDNDGNIVGSPVQVGFNNIGAIGTNRVDLFKLTNTSYATAVPNGVSTTNDVKDIRIIAFKISDFGIANAAQAATITGFKILPSGSSDPAFIAYNANAFTIESPVITTQPVSVGSCSSGSSATFSVVASGMDLRYQWTKNGVAISGATASSYTVSSPVAADAGAYAVTITNLGGSVTSNTVYLSVANSTTWNGNVSNDWNNVANWTCNIIPNNVIHANIPTGRPNYPVLGSSSLGTCNNLTIGTGASVTVQQAGILQIAGNISKLGTFNAVDGTVRLIGTTGAQTLPANTFATNYIKNLTINNTAGVTLSGELSLTGILTSTAGTFTTGNQLTLKSNVNTTAMIAPVTGTIAGQMTVERYIPSKRAFRYITSSVDATGTGTIRSNWQENGSDAPGWGTDITGTGAAANGFDPSGSNSASMFTYLNNNTGTASSWIAGTSTNIPLLAGVPYRILVRGDRTVDQFLNASASSVTTLRAHGNVKTGDVVLTNLTTNPNRYVFVGNPYQAAIDLKAVLDASTGFKKMFYQIWDPTRNVRGAYVTVNIASNTNNVTGSVANTVVQSGQAFFIQTGAATQTLNFKESHKQLETTTTKVFRNASENPAPAQMRFTLYENSALSQSESAADGFVVLFDESYSNDLDEMDAVKITNQDENIGALNSGKVLSFESRNLPTVSDVIPLSHNQYRNTNYTYKVKVDGIDNVNAYLLDKYTNSRTLLENGAETSVAFTVNASDASAATDRFDVVFSTTLGNEESVFSNSLKVYPNPVTENQFFIQLPTQQGESLNVKLVNLLGQEVYSKSLDVSAGVAKIQPETQLQSGVYLVNISNGTSTATKKLIVK